MYDPAWLAELDLVTADPATPNLAGYSTPARVMIVFGANQRMSDLMQDRIEYFFLGSCSQKKTRK